MNRFRQRGSSRSRDQAAERIRLREMVDLIRRRGPAALSRHDLALLPRLYRRASSDLARARAAGADQEARQLNDLVAEAHGAVYAAPPRRAGAVLEFVREGFPQLVRKTAAYHLLACLAFFGPMALAWAAVSANPTLGPALVPEMSGYLDQVDEVFGEDFGDEERPTGVNVFMTSFYVTNNTKVAILCFAAGIAFGLGALLLLAYNGVVIGTVAAAVADLGWGSNFLAFVAPHGAFELTGIVIAGGAGLALGYALLQPTDLPRRVHLATRAREVVRLLLGVAMLMALAAPIEGFVSPSSLPDSAKYGLGILHLVLVLSYLLLAGRGGPAEEKEPSAPSQGSAHVG